MTTHFTYIASVYLLPLNDKDEVLLLKRGNTGWRDGYWGMVSGHMDGNETPREAIIRETFEEIGVEVKQEDLIYVGTEYCKSNTERINIYFSTTIWQGTPTNKEPHKHDDLARFPLADLPEHMDYPKQFLEQIYTVGTQYKETFVEM